ncbi:MAG: methylmalonyl-CoA mutase family protein, partial [Cyclobacteriaceae bacterium]|nr:methylmalonyl-CoA mutase family protein [Cyclobacteriaceae bacterium]
KGAASKSTTPVVGITGTGGAGKSSLTDELVRRYLEDFPGKTIGIISIDPSKRKTGGALLGDRIRMNAINDERVYMRSLATRQANLSLSGNLENALAVLKSSGFDLIILETSGIGQSDSSITDFCDLSLYVMTPEFGAPTQLEKIDMLDFADMIALNKFDKTGAEDALKAIRKQYRRNHNLFDIGDEKIPVYGTIASQFNDKGTNVFYDGLIDRLNTLEGVSLTSSFLTDKREVAGKTIVPPERTRYLSDIVKAIREYNKVALEQSELANQLYAIHTSAELVNDLKAKDSLLQVQAALSSKLLPENKAILEQWEEKKKKYNEEHFVFNVRGREIKINTTTRTLSDLPVKKVALPAYRSWGDILEWNLQENVPGEFPFTAGIYPFKREGEDPTRMFAGEGNPERTNKRFHYVSRGMDSKRLSTAFDSVTLYGHDPDYRPDIYGKIGNAGVSTCCLDDIKKLYAGFDLSDPKVSVSMTINGPAPMVLAFFLNAAIDQQCEKYAREAGLTEKILAGIQMAYQKKNLEVPRYHGNIPEGSDGLGLLFLGSSGDRFLPSDIYQNIKKDCLAKARGTVQSDILKEDQAQNTCIFSTEFALKMMGDVQQYFIDHQVNNFYSVSISGYHIAEAGSNPITQLAFTLANGFTYVEYYLSRGMDINKFAPNLSFFFSNGIDPEYAVIGRVARRIWAKAMKKLYGANTRAQKLKYHIQTSGRSLHAREIDFNDIRTTLQALYAIYDNCNSLHTNAYDEAITTPTEESVRRAIAIQLIINKELGLSKNENPLQGSFIIEELTDLVEEAVLAEFERLSDRGGVPGAMESMYQRNKIQEESMYYESLKHGGEYPIIGVNTFLSDDSNQSVATAVIRSTREEKEFQITTLQNLHAMYAKESEIALKELERVTTTGNNTFEALMEVSKTCSLGQITSQLFKVGGQYRRNM